MKTAQFQEGVGLIEVLVSLVLLGIGILGYLALQTRAISATSESSLRANALNLTTDVGDFLKYSKASKTDFKNELLRYNGDFKTNGTASEPMDNCGLGASSSVCSPAQLARSAAFYAAQHAYKNSYQLNLVDCPGSLNKVSCLIASWEETNATIGSNQTDCLKTDGSYVKGARCMVVELSSN